MPFVSPRRLKQFGVLGMNARNHSVIQAFNDRRLYPRVDDKLQTKILAKKYHIPIPALVGTVSYNYQIKQVEKLIADLPDFVIKPTQGSGGKGILVITGRDEAGNYLKPSGAVLTIKDIHRHIANTLSGLYSLGGRPDKAMIERVIAFTDAFEGFSHQGVPDVRVIIFRGYPVMAMMRLSTAASDGKANLHQGAVGVGIDMITGKAKHAVQNDRRVLAHPDTDRPFSELVVPRWDEHVEIAARCYEMTGLGYFGADVVLDKHLGPLILELNARPGLAIQTANGTGLGPRIEAINGLDHEPIPPVAERIAWSKECFGG